MTLAVAFKLLAIVLTVALGWIAGRARWLDAGNERGDPARLLGNAAFYLFVPALLVRTTARLDFATMPWRTVTAFFVPVVGYLLAVYAWQKYVRPKRGDTLERDAREQAAAPAVRAITASFGNSVQVGIPLAAALFGERGLAIHVAIVSLHAIILLTLLTALVEIDLERARAQAQAGGASRLAPMIRQTLRNTFIHPVVLPVLAGLAWNATGWGIHPVLDEVLVTLSSAVVPVCLVLIGLTLAYYSVRGLWRGAVGLAVLKLAVLPALVYATARWGFELSGLPLAVVVVMGALPVGSNALIFAQRYDALQGETTAAIVISTTAFAFTLAAWLAVLPVPGATG